MPKSHPNPKVDWYFTKEKWKRENAALRSIMLSTGLTEELKWGCPCYTLNGNNVALIHGFKDYVALFFMKGVLLKDAKKILVQQTKYVQAGRQIRFTGLAEITKLKPTVSAYLKEAITLEKMGATVKMKKTAQFEMPPEFKAKLDSMPPLLEAFKALTPGRQRGYLLYFSSAKQSKTRAERVEKYLDRILDGLGLDD
jgi:uncharacterized protein YdeI (YjbR/CyaY-like superfamily)